MKEDRVLRKVVVKDETFYVVSFIVYEQLANMVVFRENQEGLFEEVLPEYLGQERVSAIMDIKNNIQVSETDIQKVLECMDERKAFFKKKAEEAVKANSNMFMIDFIEVFGRYFVYTSSVNAMYTRIAEVIPTSQNGVAELYMVPVDFFAPLSSYFATKLLSNESTRMITMQVADDVLLRLHRLDNTLFANVVFLEKEPDNKQFVLKVPMRFVLHKEKKTNAWLPIEVDKTIEKKMNEQSKLAVTAILDNLKG